MQTKAREKQSELILGQLVNFTVWIVFVLLIRDFWKGVRILYKQLLVQFNLALTRTLPQLNHLTLQVQQHIMVCTFHYFKQSSKLSVCCSRACDKETQYFRYCFKITRVYTTNLFILAPYRIFVYSNVFVLMECLEPIFSLS